jgi:hypothetical protein
MRSASLLRVLLLLALAVGLASCKPDASGVAPPSDRRDEPTEWELNEPNKVLRFCQGLG